MFGEQWKVWVLQALVMYVVLIGLTGFGFAGFVAMSTLAASAAQEASPFLFVLFIPMVLIAMVASSCLVCGMYTTAFKQLQGEPIGVADVFSGMDRFLPVLLASLCTSALVFAGLVLCIIPGIIVGGLLWFTTPLIVHGNLGVFDAMRTSKEVIQKNLLMFMLFAFVVHLIAQSGAYLCYVGLLATFPLQFTIGAVAYRDCFGVPGARSFQPPSAPNPAPYGVPAGWPPSAVPHEPTSCQHCGGQVPPGARFCPACGGGVV